MKSRRAFTLVELLVAVGITAVLAAVLLGLVNRTVTLWERSASSLILENDAQLIIDRMVADLETAYLGREPAGAEWIEYSENGDLLSSLRIIAIGAATSNDQADPNTLREVTYQMVDESGLSELYRLEGTAAETLDARYDWQTWPEVPDDEFLLGSRIDQLSVSFWDADRQQILSVGAENWPSLARIELVLLTPDGAARLQAVEEARSNEPIEQIFAETSRQFVRWVAMGGTLQ